MWEENSGNIGHVANMQEAIVRWRTQSSMMTDTGDSMKMLDKRDKNHTECYKEPVNERDVNLL